MLQNTAGKLDTLRTAAGTSPVQKQKIKKPKPLNAKSRALGGVKTAMSGANVPAANPQKLGQVAAGMGGLNNMREIGGQKLDQPGMRIGQQPFGRPQDFMSRGETGFNPVMNQLPFAPKPIASPFNPGANPAIPGGQISGGFNPAIPGQTPMPSTMGELQARFSQLQGMGLTPPPGMNPSQPGFQPFQQPMMSQPGQMNTAGQMPPNQFDPRFFGAGINPFMKTF